MQLLHVEVSPRNETSASRTVSAHLVNRIRKANPQTVVVERDLALKPLPHISGSMVEAFQTPVGARSFEQHRTLRLSDELVDELMASNAIIISTPMWNFGMPSVLKAWIDHVVRAGRTFTFSADGVEGLAKGKKLYIVVSSGSVFSQGAFAAYDQLTPSLKTALGFIGITDVELIRVEGTNDPEKSIRAIEAAKTQIESRVS